jgi:hypothetical protein
VIGKRANDYLMGKPIEEKGKDKIRFKFENSDKSADYEESDLFDLTTLGLSGIVTMNKVMKKDQKANKQNALV